MTKSTTRRSACLLAALSVLLSPEARADSASWISAIESGHQFEVIFDKTGGKFDDSKYAGSSTTDPMGTLKGGETYTVNYSTGAFHCTGFNQGTGKVGAWTYSNANPANNLISLWGRVYVFDGNGAVYDSQYGLVGRLCLQPVPVQDSVRITALSFYPGSTANPSWVVSEIGVNGITGPSIMKSATASSCWDGATRGKNNGVCVSGIDGGAFNAINGMLTSTFTSARDFWSPFYKKKDTGEWIQFELKNPVAIETITLYQYKARTLTSSLVSPKKYVAYVKSAEVMFSDGSKKVVTFPNKQIATVNLD